MWREPTSNCLQPSWPSVFIAPWSGILRPGPAAETLIAAPVQRFWAAYGLHLLVLATAVVLLLLWDATVQIVWNAPPARPGAAPATAAAGWLWIPELKQRSVGEVWRDWHANGLLGTAELTFLAVVMLTVVGTLFLAWLNLPRLHRAGPAWPVLYRGVRVVGVAGGLLIVLTIVVGAIIITLEHTRQLGILSFFQPEPLLFAGIPVGIGLIVHRIGRAVARLAEQPAELDLPPRCEACGYDLSHQSSDARCPECGLAVADSLSLNRRPGCPWERAQRRGLGEWFETVQMVVLLPREFYGKLRLRTAPTAAARFALRNYVLISLGAGLWVLVMWWAAVSGVGSFVEDWDELIAVLALFTLWTPLLCWFGHRVGAAIVISWWVARQSLPDTRWAAKVLAYESAYLWVFCAFWGAFATSFVLSGKPWITDLLGKDFFYAVFGFPGEAVVLLLGTVGLALAWLWRYIVSLRAIRWANF